MYTVKVEREKLLNIIKENREKHRAIYAEILDGYKKEVIRRLKFALDQALEGEKFITNIKLIAPKDYTENYNRIIGMLELSIEKVVEIDDTEYRQYVLDEWVWKKDFEMSNSSYGGSSFSSSSSSHNLGLVDIYK